jgi:hypothetical protein
MFSSTSLNDPRIFWIEQLSFVSKLIIENFMLIFAHSSSRSRHIGIMVSNETVLEGWLHNKPPYHSLCISRTWHCGAARLVESVRPKMEILLHQRIVIRLMCTLVVLKTLIYTGNVQNVRHLPAHLIATIGGGKCASAYWISSADTLYSKQGFRYVRTCSRWCSTASTYDQILLRRREEEQWRLTGAKS